MEHISLLINIPDEDKAPYASIIKDYVDAINAERKGTKWRPITWISIYRKVKHLNIHQLESFYQDCLKYKKTKGSFAKLFYGKLK